MPPLTPNDLSPEEFSIYQSLSPQQQPIYLDLHPQVRRLVTSRAPRNACPEDQPVCEPDQRVTVQLEAGKPPEEWMRPWRIRDARRGDLIMSPGGPSGIIGGLLSRLDPPQLYSHMGIVVEDDGLDATHLRHCTTLDDWMLHESHYNGVDVLGLAMPSEGFQEETLRYQWPGTITQEVEIAYKASSNQWYERKASGEPKRDGDGELVPLPEFRVHEPQTGEDYVVKALSFSGTVVEGQGWIVPLVVKPCKETPAVRAALHRVARAAKALRGHYRWFVYSDAVLMTTAPPEAPGQSTMLDENKLGPPQLEARRDVCVDGWLTSVDVQRTLPLVCSTFVWHAVQEANKQLPRIMLDGRANKRIEWTVDGKGKVADLTPPGQVYDPATSGCPPRMARQLHKDKVELGRTLDGLYFYGVSERQKAGEQLYDDVTKKVIKIVDEKVSSFWLTAGGTGVYIGANALIALYNAVPLAQLPALLGISVAEIKEIVKLLTDMPRDVANQLCNTFAFDWCSTDAKDSDKWRQAPGESHTVSPDNIIRSWAAPTSEDGEWIHGIYGTNIECVVDEPEPWPPQSRPEPSSWQISAGRKDVRVGVKRRVSEGVEEWAAGAFIVIGCCSRVLAQGVDTLSLPYGRYWMQARWLDPATGLLWQSPGEPVEISGATADLVAHVVPPRQNRRLLRVRSVPGAKLHLLNRHVSDEIPIFGTDPWEQDVEVFVDRVVAWNDTSLLDGWPDAAAREKAKTELQAIRHQKIPWAAPIEEWGYVELEFEVEADQHATLALSLRARLRAKDADSVADEQDYYSKPWTASELIVLQKEEWREVSIQLEITGTAYPPVRASGKVRVDNLLAP